MVSPSDSVQLNFLWHLLLTVCRDNGCLEVKLMQIKSLHFINGYVIMQPCSNFLRSYTWIVISSMQIPSVLLLGATTNMMFGLKLSLIQTSK